MNLPSTQIASTPTAQRTQASLHLGHVLILLRLIWLGAMLISLISARHLAATASWSPTLLKVAQPITFIGGAILLGEIVALTWRLVAFRRMVMMAPHSYLRIRTPAPVPGIHPATQNLPDGADLWHAAQQLFPAQVGVHAPWLAMTLSAAADEPVQFGAVIGGGSKQQQHSWSSSLRQLILGHNSSAMIDASPDPLAAAVAEAATTSGTILAWAEFLLPYGPAYPLRIPADTSSDLLGPLIAQLRPRAGLVRFAEAQIVTQPCHESPVGFPSWRIAAHRRLAAIRARSGLTLSADGRALERKLADPAAHCVIRIVLIAENRLAAQQMLRGLGVMFGQYAARSGPFLQVFRRAASGFIGCEQAAKMRHLLARAPRCVPPMPLMLPCPLWRAPAILSVAELGGIWHLPTPNLGSLANWLPARQLPAPPHAFITTQLATTPTGQQSPRITLGHALRSDGQYAPVGPMLYDLRNILHLTAGMGAGKTRFLANVCKQIIREGFTLIDGKGDDAGNLTASICEYLAQEDQGRVVLLDIADTEWPVGINPLADVQIAQPGAVDRAAAQTQSLFARLDPEAWAAAPGMQQFLEMATRLVLETVAQPTLLHVKQVLTDLPYRNSLLEGCTRHEVTSFWRVILPASSEQQKSSLNALLRRFDKLLLSDVLRGLISQVRPTLRFGEAIDQKLIVLCPIPHIAYGPLAATAAMLIFQHFLRAAFERSGTAATRTEYPLIVDEFQVLVEHGATQDVAAAVTQLRALGIPTIYAHQALAQIGELRDLLLINAENRIILRTQEPDASVYANQYRAAGLSPADISSQEPNEHQYARFVLGGHIIGPLSIRPLPWPAEDQGTVERYNGPSWQQRVPADCLTSLGAPTEQQAAQLTEAYDRSVVQLIYHTPYSDTHANLLAGLADAEWGLLQERWAAIARVQREHIIRYPGCLPNRQQRIRWLSRLGYARPRLLVEAEQRRIRRF